MNTKQNLEKILRTHSFTPKLDNLLDQISLIQSINPSICTTKEGEDLEKVKRSLSKTNKDNIWHGYYTIDLSCDTEKQSIQAILDRCVPQIRKNDIINWLLYFRDCCPTLNHAIGCALESTLDVNSLREEDKEKIFSHFKRQFNFFK